MGFWKSVVTWPYQLGGLDDQGELILGSYLWGGGKDVQVQDDPLWSDYMMANDGLRRQVLGKLALILVDLARKKTKGKFWIEETFHAECPENRGFSGYALLHGTDRTVGDFRIQGWANFVDAYDLAPGAFDVELNLLFVFNDIVNPNRHYLTDTIKNAGAEAISLGEAQSYNLSIAWSGKPVAEVRPEITIYGYPSDKVRGVRPLPKGGLDWVADNERYAQGIEGKIILELERHIASSSTSSLVARKQKLLWMCYRLSGYMGGTYLDRFAHPASDDRLIRLVRERLSGALKTEMMEAIRGKRPYGLEPVW